MRELKKYCDYIITRYKEINPMYENTELYLNLKQFSDSGCIKNLVEEVDDEETKINALEYIVCEINKQTTKLESYNWYQNLSDREKEYVDILRSEASSDTSFFSQR